jgi:predicted dehydrogenase
VKVPDHFAVTQDAIAAGKMVYCEWPLGRSLEETTRTAAMAESRGIGTIVGLQGGMAPWLRYLRTLLDDGIIGRPVSTSLRAHVPGGQWTGQLGWWQDYTKHARNGVTLQTIPMGHAFEVLSRALGEVASLSAISVRRRSTAITVEGVPDATDVPDEVIVAAALESGVVASIHYSGGEGTVGNNVVWDIVGESGQIVVTGDSGYIHYDDVTVTLGKPGSHPRVLPVPEQFAHDVPQLSGPAANVARLYRHFAHHQGFGSPGVPTVVVPDFARAVSRHRLLDAIDMSSASGERQILLTGAGRTADSRLEARPAPQQ